MAFSLRDFSVNHSTLVIRKMIKTFIMLPKQFHPKRNNCVHFTVIPKDMKGSEEGHVEVLLRVPGDSKPHQRR